LKIFPGIPEFIRRPRRQLSLAIASGALRHEIDLIRSARRRERLLCAIISAEDVMRGKPDPEAFTRAYAALSSLQADAIAPHECLVIEIRCTASRPETRRNACARGDELLPARTTYSPQCHH